MTAPQELLELVERFDNNRAAYQRGAYKEEQVKMEFINPLFGLLGWDMANTAGQAEADKQVIYEHSIKMGGGTKAPDYCFRLDRKPRFFLEAKKPSVSLKDDISPAFQLRRYAWTAKLPLSILTDFEELAVYDCRSRPNKDDKPATARLLYLTFAEYAEQWDTLAGIFSRPAVVSGSFDAYSETTRAKKGASEVDDEFLKDIESWRDLLARTIALRNPSLSQFELNTAVQTTIDRIIFLRICEDRGIESYGQLKERAQGGGVYSRLLRLFQDADDRYNSGLFHFQYEKGRDHPDLLTPGLTIDDKPLKEIINSLYFPDSPYEFSVLPADILGQVYEQFLGKVIRLTPGHRAQVEDKPEVKKAGGVYYTPTYIVDYIVKNTVGRLLQGKTPAQAAALRILDPACGSGSFLIGAYQLLLDWRRDWYAANDPARWARGKKPALYRLANGDWRLTTDERKRILLDNIFGVDIDPQAVEVTKLSLLLKVLEGETEQTLGLDGAVQKRLLQDRVLPDLGQNIKCGNSLIGPDFYAGRQPSLLEADELKRINAFDWQAEFRQVCAAGGFDAVIGNPPYIRIQALKEWAPVEVEYYKRAYKTAGKGNYDIYVVFVEKGLSLLNSAGRLGFILPHKFFNAQYGAPLRALVAAGQHLAHVVHFGDQQVFENATTYTCLMFLDKQGASAVAFVQAHDLATWRATGTGASGELPATSVKPSEWNFAIGRGADLFAKLSEMPVKLGDVAERIFQGIKTSADKIYVVEQIDQKDRLVMIHCPYDGGNYWLETDLLHPLVKGGDSRRYYLYRTNRLLIFPYVSLDGGPASLIAEKRLREYLPLTWQYLRQHRPYLEAREDNRMQGPKWYGYIYPKALDVMSLPKIFTPDIALIPSFSLDPDGDAFFTGGVAGGYGILVSPGWSRSYVLGVLNSRISNWYIRQTATSMRGGYYSYEARFIRSLPVGAIDVDDAADRARHDQMVQLVERMLDLHKRLHGEAKTAHDQTLLQRQIDATDQQIDALVYELYGLTAEEIDIVRGEGR